MKGQMRGIYAIPTTPFNENMELDEGGLRSCIRFCLEAGCHGIVTPVNASEFIYLSDDERKKVVEIAVEEANGKVPVVAGVSGTCTKLAVQFSRHAEYCGADAVIAMPPYVAKASLNEIHEYFYQISKAVKIPIFIQNYIAPIGTPLSAEFLIKLISEIDHVFYIKEETELSSHIISRVQELSQVVPRGNYMGIMGGKAGKYMIDEYRRGTCGNMPACEIVDIHVKIWEALESGDEKKAAELHEKILPLINFEAMYGAILYKEVLRRRGVLVNSYVRSLGGKVLDKMDHVELDRILDEIKPLYSIN